MSKYQPLQTYLEKIQGQSLTLSFEQIERIIGDKLPKSAYKYQAWWANGGHYYADYWLQAGWKVNQVKFGENVKFIRN